ncbi:hypothetical protein DLE60_19155, partial [Micromonospora globispora]
GYATGTAIAFVRGHGAVGLRSGVREPESDGADERWRPGRPGATTRRKRPPRHRGYGAEQVTVVTSMAPVTRSGPDGTEPARGAIIGG